MHSELLDDLEDVNFLTELCLGIFEKEVISLPLGPTTAAIAVIEAPDVPESAILVRKRRPVLNLLSHLIPVVLRDRGHQIVFVISIIPIFIHRI